MARFTYQAENEQGSTVVGVLEAASRDAALQTLGKRYALVKRLQQAKRPKPWSGFFGGKGLNREQMLAFYQQMAVSTNAGVPLKQGLDMMGGDSDSPRLQETVFGLSAALNNGSSLSAAMMNYPEVFPKFQTMLVRAGESSGRLPEVMEQLAEDVEQRDKLTSQVRTAIAYPGFVLTVACCMSAAMLAFGVPQVKSIFDEMGTQLPLPTRVLVWLGDSLGHYGWMWVVGIMFTIWAIKRAWATPRVKLAMENMILTSWPFGHTYRLLNVATFARTLGLLYRSGLPLTQAMEIVADATTSSRMQVVISHLRAQVAKGETLSSGMRNSGFFPSMALEMVSTGENSGTLERMLHEIDKFYSRRCETAIKGLTAMLEPALTVVMGVMLGGIILGLALPFLNMSSMFT